MKRASLLLLSTLLFSLSFGTENLIAQALQNAKETKTAECALTLQDAPPLLGMRLGMSLEETKAAAPNLGLNNRRSRKANGVSTSLSSKPSEEAEGVVNSFLDDKLFEIDVLYNSANKWNSTAEFVREFSRKFNLPEQAWIKTTGGNNYLLTCQGFTIEARDQNHIVLSSAAADAEKQKRADEIAAIKDKN